MTVKEWCARANLTVFCMGNADAEIENCYCGDFLSNVISRAPDACAWLTVMNNVNVAAVATLTDCACVVICEGVAPDEQLAARAKSQNINLLGSSRDVYQTAKMLFEACGV